MAENCNDGTDSARLLEAIRLREVHGDGNVLRLAERMTDAGFARRLDMLDAIQQCRDWLTSGSRTWHRIREGVYGVQVALRLQVKDAGRLVGSWGDGMQEALHALTWPGAVQPQLVALGDGDDLQRRSGMAVIDSGEAAFSCEVCLFSRKDGSVTVELHVIPIHGDENGGDWIAELWQGTEPVQRIPIEDGLAAFGHALAPGNYRIVVCAEGERHEIDIEVV